jgi:hypothetical protein
MNGIRIAKKMKGISIVARLSTLKIGTFETLISEKITK